MTEPEDDRTAQYWRYGEPLEYFGTPHEDFSSDTWFVWGFPTSESGAPLGGYCCSFADCFEMLNWLRGSVAAGLP